MKWFDISGKKHDVETDGDYEKEMNKSDGVRKFMEVSVDGEDADVSEEEGIKLFFTISTPHIDRDGDTIDQRGWDLSEYKKNPVVLWAHDSTALPVAKANATYLDTVTAKSPDEESIHLMSIAEFPSRELYPFGNMVGRLYKNGYLHGASVGFLPLEYEMSKDRDGFAPVDFKKQRLLEWSAVPVPSNPEGLVQARSAGIDLAPMVDWAEQILDGEGALILPKHLIEEVRKNATSKVFILDKRSGIQLDMFNMEEQDETVEIKTKEITEAPEAPEEVEEEKAISEKEDKGTISYDSAHPDGSPKAPEDEAWDGPKYVAEANIEQLRQMCTYYSGDGGTKGDFKLPHHKPDGTVVLRGVQAAMAALMGARGGVDILEADRRGVYNHLAEHYRAFDKEPPEFKSVEETMEKQDGAYEDIPEELLAEAVAADLEQKELTPCVDEAEAVETLQKDDDDLRRLAKATFEQRVLSLTQELKSLLGEISRGVDR